MLIKLKEVAKKSQKGITMKTTDIMDGAMEVGMEKEMQIGLEREAKGTLEKGNRITGIISSEVTEEKEKEVLGEKGIMETREDLAQHPFGEKGGRAKGSPWRRNSVMNVAKKATLHISAPRGTENETKEEEKEKEGIASSVVGLATWLHSAEWGM